MGQEHFVSKPPVKSQHVSISAHHVAKSKEYKTYFDFEVLSVANLESTCPLEVLDKMGLNGSNAEED